MGMEYCINKDRNLVEVSLSGNIDLLEWKDFEEKLVRDTNFSKGMNSLINLGKAKLKFDLNSVEKGISFFKGIQDRRGSGRIVLVAGNDLHFGLGRMLEMLSTDLIMDFKVCHHRDEALQWLENSSID